MTSKLRPTRTTSNPNGKKAVGQGVLHLDRSLSNHSRTDSMKLTKRTTARVGIAILLIAVVAPFVVFAVPQVVGAEHSYVVISSSMTPAIAVNDAVIVNSVSPDSVHKGDVIAFHARSSTDDIDVTTHRVVGIEHESGLAFETKGDANEKADPKTVPSSALVGRVAFTIPLIGYVVAFASTQLGLILLVALPLGLLMLGEFYDLARAVRNSRAASDRPDEQAETDGGTDVDERMGADERTDGTESEE